MKGIDLFKDLADLVDQVDTFKGEWREAPSTESNEDGTISTWPNEAKLAWDVNRYLWEYSGQYIPSEDGNWEHDKHDLKYPNIDRWADKLEQVMEDDSFDGLSMDEVYSFIFGLHHRNRIIDGLWISMLERGVTQKLLHRLLELEET